MFVYVEDMVGVRYVLSTLLFWVIMEYMTITAERLEVRSMSIDQSIVEVEAWTSPSHVMSRVDDGSTGTTPKAVKVGRYNNVSCGTSCHAQVASPP